MKSKSFVTVASGKKYLSFAYTLARSYRFHNDLSIPFYIISDQEFHLPNDLTWVKKLVLPGDIMGNGLEYRFRFNRVIPTDEAFFIDSDSIIYGNLSSIFERFSGEGINVVGIKVKSGDWADLDTPAVLNTFNIDYLIRFCGAFYYVTKSKKSSEICEYALILNKDARQFQQHKHGVNDEPIMSIAMSKSEVEPVPDDGSIWGDVFQLQSHKEINVFTKPPIFENSNSQPKYKFWLPTGHYSPLILHMGGAIYNKNPWIFESLRLRLYYRLGLSVQLSNMVVKCLIIPAYFLLKKAKKTLETKN